MTKQKIIFITFRNIADLNTGDKIFSYSLLKQISEIEDVSLINILNEGKYSDLSIRSLESITNNIEFYFEEERSAVLSLILSLITSNPYTFEIKSRKKIIRNFLKEVLKNNNPDIVIWDHFRTLAYYDSSFSKYNNILIQHNNESELYKQRGKNKSLIKRLIFNWQSSLIDKVMNIVNNDFKKCVYISSYDIVKSVKTRNTVVLKRINLYFNHNHYIPEKSKEFDLLFLGSLDWEPNIHGIIWFLENVFHLLPINIKIAIVGRNPNKRIMNFENERIRVFPNVERAEDFFHKSKIFISPVLIGGGINIKILEALSYGIPIVTTGHSLRGYDDLEILKKCDTPEDFANQIIEINNNWENYKNINTNENNYYKKYQIESKKEIQKIISL